MKDWLLINAAPRKAVRGEYVNRECILSTLKIESRWLTFDELYSMVHCDCDWTDFALRLEQLVEQGEVQYILPCGADIGYYGIDRL